MAEFVAAELRHLPASIPQVYEVGFPDVPCYVLVAEEYARVDVASLRNPADLPAAMSAKLSGLECLRVRFVIGENNLNVRGDRMAIRQESHVLFLAEK